MVRNCLIPALLLVTTSCKSSEGASDSAGGTASGSGGSAASGTGGQGASSGSGGADRGGEGGEAGASSGGAPATSLCTPLSELPEDAILVTPEQADELPAIVSEAPSGATIGLADGTYLMTGADEAARRLQINKPGITLRSASGVADSVVLDGEYLTNEMITVSASDVTIAAITLMHAVDHPIHVTGGPSDSTRNVRLTGLRILDSGEQFVKVNSSGAMPNTYADDGVLECSHLEMTAEGRPYVEPNPGGCYTGGIDAHSARGWVVRGNTFRGIYCEGSGLAEHAIHFWSASRDTLVEQNTIIDCARGIGFGLGDGTGAGGTREYADDPAPGISGYVGHYDGTIRNNWVSISAGLTFFDTGIELEQAYGARVLHNTLLHPTSAFASIAPRFANTRVTLSSNLMVSLRERDGAVVEQSHNSLESAPDLFDSGAGDHNLHLTDDASVAIDQGEVLDDAGLDIDGETHDARAPDIGADEAP